MNKCPLQRLMRQDTGEQLSAKADKLREKFADFSLPELEVFDSQTEHYRMR